jgi:hypothetical protein
MIYRNNNKKMIQMTKTILLIPKILQIKMI